MNNSIFASMLARTLFASTPRRTSCNTKPSGAWQWFLKYQATKGRAKEMAFDFNLDTTIKELYEAPSYKSRLGLLSRIIIASTEPGAWILDPFAGSSTTGIAANLLGRRFLGIEQDEVFAKISKAHRSFLYFMPACIHFPQFFWCERILLLYLHPESAEGACQPHQPIYSRI